MVQEGDYIVLQKGGVTLSGNYDMLDTISEENEVEISLFFANVRVMSTIADEQGNLYIGNEITSLVTDQVMKAEQECFFDNVTIQEEDFFSYYRPLFNADGTCVGMIGVAKPVSSVEAMVRSAIYSNMAIMIVAILLTGFFITYFTIGIVKVIKRIMNFLNEIAKGNLDTNLDYIVAKRNDELGEMGRLTERVQVALRKLVERDVLTDLLNRRSGEKKLDAVYENSKQYVEPFAIAIGDIDFFKKVNDTYGHEAGDAVLREVSRILRESMAGKGHAIRWGGEEFLMIFERMDAVAGAAELNRTLDRIRQLIVETGDVKIQVTMTFGVVDGDTSHSMNDIIKQADDQLYKGKMNGRNQVVQ